MNLDHEALSQIDTKTLLAEIAYRAENFSKYKIVQGMFNSFQDYDGVDWVIKIQKRHIQEVKK